MPVISAITSGATAPPDFTNLQTWEAWAQGAPNGEDEYVAECYDDFGGALLTPLVISAWFATTAANHPTIRPARPADGHQGVVGAGLALQYNQSAQVIKNEVSHLLVQGLTLRHSVGNSNVISDVTQTTTGCIYDSLIVEQTGSTNNSVRLYSPGAIVKNCLIINGLTALETYLGLTLQNITVVGTTNYDYLNNVTDDIVDNCVFAGSGNTANIGAVGGTYTNCASRDTSATGTLPQTGVADADFVNYTGDASAGSDYSPAPTSTKLVDTGTTPPVLTLDIAGNTRSDPDEIGAYAIAAPAANDFADTNAFTITIAAGVVPIPDLDADTGVYNYSGGDSTLFVYPPFNLDTGVYAYFGGNSDLSFPDTPTLDAETGVFAYSGGESTLDTEYPPLDAETGVYVYSGGESTIEQILKPLDAETGVYAYTGNDVEMAFGILAQNVPSTGTDGPAFMYPLLVFPDDTDKFVTYTIVDPPNSGAFDTELTSAFTWQDTPNTEFFTFTMEVDGVPRGGETEVSMRVGL